MEYQLDITSNYQQFLCLDSCIGIENYLSFDFASINNDFEVNLENIEVNMSESIWYSPIIEKNPKSIISSGLAKIDLNDYSSIFTLLLRKAKLVIKNARCIYLKLIDNKDEIYHTVDSNFSIGDKYIWLVGKSADYPNMQVKLKIIFSDELNFIFEESDILIQTIEFDNFFTKQDVDFINQYQDYIIKLKNRSIDGLNVNNISSKFLDFDFSKNYFISSENGNIAIKNYKNEE
ncbi:hypothetical protein RHO14_07865 [Orbus wheelerorum]|uniref:hypothetical protein n=1 Tax=Orbus wheelerorum TaxID=3074111 RepID=UPI00370D6B38